MRLAAGAAAGARPPRRPRRSRARPAAGRPLAAARARGSRPRRRLRPGGRRRPRPHDALRRRRHARGGDPGGEGDRPRLRRDHRPQQPRREAASRATATACSSSWAPSSRRPPATSSASASTATPPGGSTGTGSTRLEDVRDLGGVPFAAHPFSARTDLRWNGWDLPGPWGIELLNGDSDARRAGPRVLLSVGLYRLNPGYALLQGLRPPDEALRRWDEMLARRDVVGLAGSDAHSRLALTKTPGPPVPVLRVALRAGPQPPPAGPPPDRRRRGRPRRGARRLPPGSLLPRARRPRPGRRASASRSRASPGSAGRWATTCPGPRACAPSSAAGCRRARASSSCGTDERWGRGRGRSRSPFPAPASTASRPACRAGPCPGSITNPVYVHDEATREARAPGRRLARPAAARAGGPPPRLARRARPPSTRSSTPPRGWTRASRARSGARGRRRAEARLPARCADARRSPSRGARS